MPGEKQPSPPQPEEGYTPRQQLEARVKQLFIEQRVFSEEFAETKIRELDDEGLLKWEAWLVGQIKLTKENRAQSV